MSTRNLLLWKNKYMYRFKVKKWRNIYHGNANGRKQWITILISNKAHLKQGKSSGIKRKQYIMKKGSSLYKDIITLMGTCWKQTLKTCDARHDGTAKRNRQIRCQNWRLQHPIPELQREIDKPMSELRLQHPLYQ